MREKKRKKKWKLGSGRGRQNCYTYTKRFGGTYVRKVNRGHFTIATDSSVMTRITTIIIIIVMGGVYFLQTKVAVFLNRRCAYIYKRNICMYSV